MLDDIDTDTVATQVESVNACSGYNVKLTKEDLGGQQKAVAQRDLKNIKTDWKNSLNLNDGYDQHRP